ncbi:hypothetical protein P8C59_004766 [Phyllachora maydis]|uniref:Uncharacterized protein n=1 Tax=Phyllachora maydis TaxID=1825666 RepID=A0AAD9I426_9PEZI|nr:hypothetical protein P8C59_004766 [Phyllachora maydis]
MRFAAARGRGGNQDFSRRSSRLSKDQFKDKPETIQRLGKREDDWRHPNGLDAKKTVGTAAALDEAKRDDEDATRLVCGPRDVEESKRQARWKGGCARATQDMRRRGEILLEAKQ